jgi:pimeloyl-ACP methyl ester carboxylesterase
MSAAPASRLSEAPSGDEAWRLFLTPPRVRQAAAERRVLAAAHRHEIPFGGHSLAAWSWGEGPAALLVHGWCGRASQLGAFVDPLVAAGLRVVAADAPAHGESPGERSSLFEFAQAVASLVAREQPVRAVIAHSMGAASTAMALRTGLPVERAVLIAPIFRLKERVARFARRVGLEAAAERDLVRRLEQQFGPTAWDDSSLDVVARDLEMPALIVHDRDDAEIPFEDGERTAAAWRGARFFPTAGLGHRSLLWDRGVIGEVVRFCTAAGDR